MPSPSSPPTQAQVSAQLELLTLRVLLGAGLVASLIGALFFASMSLWPTSFGLTPFGSTSFEPLTSASIPAASIPAASIAGASTSEPLASMPSPLSDGSRAALLAACLLLAGVFGILIVAIGRIGAPMASRVAGWAAMVVIVLISALLGEGVHAPVLALFGVVICVCRITAGLRIGAAMTAFAVLAVVGLAWAEVHHRLPVGIAGSAGASAIAGVLAGTSASIAADAGTVAGIAFRNATSVVAKGQRLELHVVIQLLLIAAGLVGGTLIARVTAIYTRAANDRERRFGGLLRIAADWYWEMDHNFRFTHLAESTPGASLVSVETRLGAAPWDILNFGIDATAMDAHRSDLEAHRPFRGVLVRRRDAQGRPRYARVSGQPRFDNRGVFSGYWGVGRDTTPEVTAQVSVAASEARYRDLFNRMPSALVLHRAGRIVNANPAAVALLGYDSLIDMAGQELRRHFPDPEAARSWAERAQQLDTMRIGEGLDAVPLRMTTADGHTRFVQGSPVKIDAPEGPAVLSIFHDETEQRMADAALRRSQSLLSHLVESSPDSITLCELDSGRYVMVNEAFVRWFGFSADETIGRTSAELGIWAHAEDEAALIEALRRNGRVDNFPALFLDKRQARIRVMVSGAIFEEDGEAYVVLASRDITDVERTRLEHQAILQSAGIGIAFTRHERFLHTNPHFERIFGWSEGSLAGERGSVIWPSMREYEEVGGLAGPLLSAAKPVELERPMRRLDGTIFWCRLLAKVVDPRAPAQGGTIWIAEDVTERRRVEQALANARDDAESANRAKSAFLANTSHEIRTPLNGLLGMARLALDDQLDDARRRQYIAQMHDSAQSLAGIISDILDFSKIEAGKFTLESLPFSLPDVLRSVHRSYQPLAEEKGLTLELAMPEDLPTLVRGDALRVRQIITNYVSNAIKFTTSGRVSIAVTRHDGGWTRLAVTDSGPGIEPTTVQRLFTPFMQADGSTTRRHGGTGLGLSICRQLAQLMHGDVGVSSDPGHGSTFWADLPLTEVALQAQAVALLPLAPDDRRAGRPESGPRMPAQAFGLPEAGMEAMLTSNGPLQSPGHEALPPTSHGSSAVLRGARVLVAEDNPVNMMITVAMLEQWGIQTAQAVDGAAAVEAAIEAAHRGTPFDLVLMDVQMPRMSGHEAARVLRGSFDEQQLPIIALTAAALVSERDQAMAAGMNDFLTKPIDASRLRESLAYHLAQGPLHRQDGNDRSGGDSSAVMHRVG